jgi:hypothetical protein
MVIAFTGGYGQGGYRSVGDRAFQDKLLAEMPVVRTKPVWHNSPYRHYFLARWYEQKGMSAKSLSEKQNPWLMMAIQEMLMALYLQPTRSLFWERLGYLMGSCDCHTPSMKSQNGFGYQDALAKALNFSPGDTRLQFDIGSYLWKLGNPYGLSVLQEAVSYNPSLGQAYQNLLHPSYTILPEIKGSLLPVVTIPYLP